MCVSGRWFWRPAALFLCLAHVCACSDEIGRITERVQAASDGQTARQAMTELVAIDSAAAATAFANELARVEATLDRANEETLVPYLSPVFGFTDKPEIRQSLVPTFEQLLEGDIPKYENLYLSAALAKFGAQDKVQWLIDEYRRSRPDLTQLSYVSSAFELLCRTNQDLAVRFVVEEAVQSIDPTQKLATARCLREVGNPASLEVMRRWIGVESNETDQSVVEHYLQAIILFGDGSDLEFVEWVDANVSIIYGPDESRIRPAIETARARIDERARSR